MDAELDRLVHGVLRGELSRDQAAELIARSHTGSGSDSLFLAAQRAAFEVKNTSPQQARTLLELCQLAGSRMTLDAEDGCGIALNLGALLVWHREPAAAIPHLERALAIARQHGLYEHEINAIASLAGAYGDIGETDKAATMLDAGLALCATRGDQQMRGRLLGTKGSLLRHTGDFEGATQVYADALTLARAANDRELESNVLGNLANVTSAMGRSDEAVAHYRGAISVALDLGDFRTGANKSLNLANTYVELRRPAEALAEFDRALDLATRAGDVMKALDCSESAGALTAFMKDWPAAAVWHERCAELAERADVLEARIAALLDLAFARVMLSDSSAIAAVELATELARTQANGRLLLRALHLLEITCDWTRDVDKAARALTEFLAIAVRLPGEEHLEELSNHWMPCLTAIRYMRRVIRQEMPLNDAIAAFDASEPDAGQRDRTRDLALNISDTLPGHSFVLLKLAGIAADLSLARKLTLHLVAARAAAGVHAHDESREHAHQALGIAESLNDQHALAQAYGQLAVSERHRRQFEAARLAFERAIELCKKLGEESNLAMLLGNAANLHRQLGEADAARERRLQALAIYTRLGNDAGLALCETNLGEDAMAEGQHTVAIEHLERALPMVRAIGDFRLLGNVSVNLIHEYGEVGRVADAEALLNGALAHAGHSNYQLAAMFHNLGDAHLKQGSPGRAAQLFEKAAAYADVAGDPAIITTILSHWLNALTSIQAYAQARPVAERLVSAARRRNQHRLAFEAAAMFDTLPGVSEKDAPKVAAIVLEEWWRSARIVIASADVDAAVLALLADLRTHADVEERMPAWEREHASGLGTIGGLSGWLIRARDWSREAGAEGAFDRFVAPLAVPDASTSEHLSPERFELFKKFARLVSSLNLRTDSDQGMALSFLAQHPDLLEPDVAAWLDHRVTASSSKDETHLLLRKCRGLIEEVRRLGSKDALLRRFGGPADNRDANAPFAQVSLDGETARLTLPDEAAAQEKAIFAMSMGFSRGSKFDTARLLNDCDAEFFEIVDRLAEEAASQGRHRVAERLRSLHPMVANARRQARLGEQLTSEQMEVVGLIDRALGLARKMDIEHFVEQHPELRSDASLAVMDLLVSLVPEPDYVESVTTLRQWVVEWRQKAESPPSERPLDGLPLYELARQLQTGAISEAEAVERARALEPVQLAAVAGRADDLSKSDPALADLCIRLACERALTLDDAFVMFLGTLIAAYDGPFSGDALTIQVAQRAVDAIAKSEHARTYFHAEVLHNLARLYGKAERPREALATVEACLALGDALSFALKAMSLARAAEFAAARGDLVRAFDYTRQALTVYEGLGDRAGYRNTLGTQAEVLRDLGRFAEAEGAANQHHELTVATNDEGGIAAARDLLGTVVRRLGYPRQALAHHAEARAIFDRLGDHRRYARATAHQGSVERDLGRPERGIELYREALTRGGNVSLVDRAIWNGNIGAAYSEIGDLEEARHYTELALNLQRQTGDERMCGTWLANLASIASMTGWTADGMRLGLEADAAFERSGDAANRARILGTLSALASSSGDPALARDYVDRALAQVRSTNDPLVEAELLMRLGDLQRDTGDTEAARATLHRAVQLSGTSPRHEVGALITAARLELQDGGSKSLALSVARRAATRIEELRTEISDVEQRRHFFRRHASLYGDLVGLLSEVGAHVEAFEHSERMRARVLADMLAADPSVTERRTAAVVTLDQLQQALPARSVMLTFCVTARGTFAFIVPGADVDVAPHGTAAVTGARVEWVAERRLFALAFPAFTVQRVHELVGTAEGSWLREYRAFVHGTNHTANADRRAMLQALDRLLMATYAELLAAIEPCLTACRGVTRLIVVPHTGLHLVPLHAAFAERFDESTGTNAGRRRFAETLEISYAPSATVWCVARQRVTQARPDVRRALAVENPTLDLLYAGDEIRAFSHRVAWPCRILTGAEATIDRFTDEAKTASLIHVCCHGTWNFAAPERSALRLADGELRLSDIFDRIEVPIGSSVIMSACETGLTDATDPAAEQIGLVSGFVYAGAGCVMSTLWAVNDLSTALLIDRMYEAHLTYKATLANALRDAQRWLRTRTHADILAYIAARKVTFERLFASLEELKTRPAWARVSHVRPFEHPFYWAGFVVMDPTDADARSTTVSVAQGGPERS
jgi:CHAT domain-containing protein/tetratricopeptide (TPR) repeat protein